MQWMFMNFAGHGIEKMVNSYFGVSRPFFVRIKWEAQWRVTNKRVPTDRQIEMASTRQQDATPAR